MTKTNPLLDGIDLGSIGVALPSMGQWYKPGVLADGVDVGEVMVGPYSLMDEMRLKDPYQIMSGKALTGLLSRSCPAIEKVEELLVIDAEAIMIAARIASHGKASDITISCDNRETTTDEDGKTVPVCRNKEVLQVDLQAILAGYSPEVVGTKEQWTVKIANGQVVQLAPVKYVDSIEIMKSTLSMARQYTGDGAKTMSREEITELEEKVYAASFETQREFIAKSIEWIETPGGDKVFDAGLIQQWVDMVPSELMSDVLDVMEERAAGISKFGKVAYVCPKCGKEQPSVPIVGDPQRFFGKDSTSAKTKQKPSS